MPSLDAGALTQRQTGNVRLRSFVWFTVRDRSDDSAYSEGYWTGDVPITASVIDARTGSTVSRAFQPAPGLIEVGEIRRVSDLTAQTVSIRLNAVAPRVQDLLRLYDPRLGEVQVYIGDFDPVTGEQLGAARPELLGRIDTAPVTTGPAQPGSPADGSWTITVASEARQMLRSSTGTRSDQDQRRRSATDKFFQDVATVADWEIFWGSTGGKAAVKKVDTPRSTAPRDDAGGSN